MVHSYREVIDHAATGGTSIVAVALGVRVPETMRALEAELTKILGATRRAGKSHYSGAKILRANGRERITFPSGGHVDIVTASNPWSLRGMSGRVFATYADLARMSGETITDLQVVGATDPVGLQVIR